MSGHGAAPGAVFEAAPGRRISKQEPRESSAAAAVCNSICERPRSYDDLIEDMFERNPRLGAAAIDRAIGLLIKSRTIWLSDDGRWTMQGHVFVSSNQPSLSHKVEVACVSHKRRTEIAREIRKENQAQQDRHYACMTGRSIQPPYVGPAPPYRRPARRWPLQYSPSAAEATRRAEGEAQPRKPAWQPILIFGTDYAAGHRRTWEQVADLARAA